MNKACLFCAGAAALISATPAEAYPLNPWGARVPDKTIALNPFLYAYPGPSFTGIGYAGVGFGERFDVYAGLSVNSLGPDLDNVLTMGTMEFFPRVFLTEDVAIAPHLYYTPGGEFIPALEVHSAKAFGSFSLTTNAGWKPVVDDGFSSGSVFLNVAPEYYFSDQFSAFVEVAPTIPLESAGDTYVSINPGIWFALDAEQKHSFALALQIAVPPEDPFSNSLSGGIWYATTIGY